MRIAVFSDIHGNSIALEAVLADIQGQGGVDAYWLLGDLVAIGYDPIGVLERIVRLPNIHLVRGNTEFYLINGTLPPPFVNSVEADKTLLPVYRQVVASFAWTHGAVTTAGWLSWLQDVPSEDRIVLPDGTRLLAVHVAPAQDDGPGLRPTWSDAQVDLALGNSKADLVCVGHTHWAMERRVGNQRLVNVGSVSNPFPPDLRACYVLLDCDNRGYHVEFRRVDYDREQVIASVEHVHHPAASYIIDFMRGRNRPAWTRAADKA